MADVQVTPTRYAVSAIPAGHRSRRHFEITVEWRGNDLWAVCHAGECLGSDGEWEWEPSNSNREDDWVATHRFDLDTALRLAREAAPHLTVNGHTVAEVLAEGH